MPKLPSLTPKKVIDILQRNGFIFNRAKGSHHIYRHIDTKKLVIVPIHKKDLPKGTLIEILKQAGLDKKQLFK